MASLPPADTEIATRQDLERVETSLQKDLSAAESRMKAYVWKVALGTSVVLGLTIVTLTIGGMAVLLQVLDVI